MDITNENFLDKLPEIRETIQDCDFIAIDTELSGLSRDHVLDKSDIPEERFRKRFENSRGYFIMQFGLSCFTKIDNLRYSNRTYNVYVFPQPHKPYGDKDRTFSIHVNAIQFLTENSFDFNRLFKHGVSYLTFQETKELTHQLKNQNIERSNVIYTHDGVPKFVPIPLRRYCRDTFNSVSNFVAQQQDKERLRDDVGQRDGEMPLSGDKMKGPTLKLRDCGPHHKRLILIKALECLPFADNLFIETIKDSPDGESYLEVEYIDKETKKERQEEAFVTAKGFLDVIETIILNKKPIVGHNLFLDLVHVIDQFIERLSGDYNSFRDICLSLFPLIYDTKHIAHSALDPKTLTNNQSRLNDLYCLLKVNPAFQKIEIDHLGEFSDGSQLPHQAGYDAYMSGYSFIVMCEAYLRERGVKQNLESDSTGRVTIARQTNIVSEFANKIYLSYSHEYTFYNLSG